MLRNAGMLAKVALSLALSALLHPSQSAASIAANYDLAIPVSISSKTTFEVQESLPVLKLKTQGTQQLKFEMKGLGEIDDLTSSRLPADVRITIKDLFIHLTVNGKELIFDPRGEKVTVPLNHLSQLIDRSLNLRLDSQGYLVGGGDTFDSIFREFPALKQMAFQNALSDHLQHLFALHGREVLVGEVIQLKPLSDTPIGPSPQMTCEIVEIDDDEIRGVIKGKLAPVSTSFSITVEGKEQPGAVKMILTGDVTGKVSWNRRNALISTLNNDYRYQAKMGLGDTEWMMLMTMNNAITASSSAASSKGLSK